MQPENPQQSGVVLRLPVSPKIRPASPYPRSAPDPASPYDVREQIFNTVRFVSYSRVNEVESIEELTAELERAILIENERFPDAVRLKPHSVDELARTLADWSWKNKRKARIEIPACKANDHLDMALAEIRILAPHGKAFALLQLFRQNHAGGAFLIQPEKMARECYSGTTWTIKNYREARDVLLREGFISIHEKTPGRAVRYVLASRPLTDADRRANAEVLKFVGARS
jgi:hypothetical protein